MVNWALSGPFGCLLALSRSDVTSFGQAAAYPGLGGGVFVQSLPGLPTFGAIASAFFQLANSFFLPIVYEQCCHSV